MLPPRDRHLRQRRRLEDRASVARSEPVVWIVHRLARRHPIPLLHLSARQPLLQMQGRFPVDIRLRHANASASFTAQ